MFAGSHTYIPSRLILAALGAAALLALVPGPASAQPGETPGSLSPARLSLTEATMLRDLARNNLAEVATGKLALAKAQDVEVKAFAQTMVDDHSAAMKDLEQLAQSKHITLPTQPTGAQKATMKGMESLRPGSFNKMYMAQSGVIDHRKTLALLKRIQARGKDAEFRALAGKMQPTVEHHLRQAVELASK
jgi:putative membrane protein